MLYPKKNLLPPLNNWIIRDIPNVSVLGEYSFTILANTAVQYFLKLKPNTQYTLSFETSDQTNARFYLFHSSEDKVRGASARNNQGSFTTNASGYIEVYIYANAYPLTYSKWQLEEGSTATPFEPYQLGNKKAVLQNGKNKPAVLQNGKNKKAVLQNGKNKPAVLYPQKNLFDLDNFIKNATLYSVSISPIKDGMRISSTTKTVYARALVNINLKPNTNYTISSLFGVNIETDYVYIRVLSGALSVNYSSTNQNPLTFNTGNVVNPVTLAFYITFATSGLGYVDFSKIQLEEGTSTPYEPYRLGNKKAK